MNERLIAELSAACSQIGYDHGTKYDLDKNCFGKLFMILLLKKKINVFYK